MIHRFETMFPAELERHLARSPVLVLPLGTIEWHSHHLPVGMDGMVAQRLGEQMAEAMDGVLAPTCYWAVGGVPFPFTLNLPLDEVEALLRIAVEQHAAMGFKAIVLFTGHFGLDQTLATKRAALAAMRRSDTVVLPLTTYDLVTDFYTGDHAGVGETSLMMAIRPDLVRLAEWPAGDPLPGVIGDDPRSGASADLGHRILAKTSARAALLVSQFLTERLSRERWIDTLERMVDVLEQTRLLRQTLPRERVPPIATQDYLEAWMFVAKGDLEGANDRLGSKLQTLEALSSL